MSSDFDSVKTYLDWQRIHEAIDVMANRYSPCDVYGVPRGGCIPASMLATRWGRPVLDEPHADCLVVDDIIDSGRTMARFDSSRTIALVSRTGDHRGVYQLEGWIEFPWEKNETGPEDAVVRLIEFIGRDIKDENLRDTPKRVVRALLEMTAGEHIDPASVLKVDFPGSGYDEIVSLSGIEFYSLCEHHLLPFHGRASVAYLPSDRIVGLSKLARVVEIFAKRLQVQERMTQQIADAIDKTVKPLGTAVLIQAQHLCMGARGVQKPGAQMTTSVMRGVFRTKPEARAEVLRLLQKGGEF